MRLPAPSLIHSFSVFPHLPVADICDFSLSIHKSENTPDKHISTTGFPTLSDFLALLMEICKEKGNSIQRLQLSHIKYGY